MSFSQSFWNKKNPSIPNHQPEIILNGSNGGDRVSMSFTRGNLLSLQCWLDDPASVFSWLGKTMVFHSRNKLAKGLGK